MALALSKAGHRVTCPEKIAPPLACAIVCCIWAFLHLAHRTIRADSWLSTDDRDVRLHVHVHASLHDSFSTREANGTLAMLHELSANRELIITATTCGYIDMTLNWIKQLESVGIRNFLVIAEDLPTFEYLLQIAPRHTIPSHVFGRPFSRHGKGAAEFDSPDFDWCSRPYYLRELIRRNFSAVWVDSDAMLLTNPYDLVPVTDIVLVDDAPKLHSIAYKYRHYYCSCFVMVRPGSSAEILLSVWAQLCGNRTQDQVPLNEALDVLERAIAWAKMPKAIYPTGYDSERLTLARQPGWESPAWIHANWRQGVEAKEEFLSRFGLWRNIRAPLQCAGTSIASVADAWH